MGDDAVTADQFWNGFTVGAALAVIVAALWARHRHDTRRRRARAIAAWAWQQHVNSAPGMVDRRRVHPSRLPALCLRCQVTVVDLPTHVRLAHSPRVVGAEDRSDYR